MTSRTSTLTNNFADPIIGEHFEAATGDAVQILDDLAFIAAAYFALATAASFINEQISAVLHWRGDTLYAGVLNLFNGQKALTDGLFCHALVASTSRDKTGVVPPAGQGRGRPSDRLYRPSYIAPRSFSLAFHQLLAGATIDDKGVITPAAVASAVHAPDDLLNTLRTCADSLKSDPFGTQLSALLVQSQGDYDKLLAATDQWFNRQMDRVEGWYRRKTQYVLVIVAVLMTLLLGVDSLRVVEHLNQLTPDVRTKLVDSATSNLRNAKTYDDALKVVDPPDALLDVVIAGPVWNSDARHLVGAADVRGHAWHHLAGLILTMMSIALGGPFWFDLLCSITNLRMAGRKPQTQPGTAAAT